MRIINKIKAFAKTAYFNFYYLSPQNAIKFPIKVHSSVIIGSMGDKKALILNDNSKVLIGYGQSFGLGGTTYWKMGKKGKIIFNGNARIGRGTQIIADGEISFGKDFYCNANCIINCGRRIVFGDNCLIGWNVEIIDGDGHKVFHSGIKSEEYKEIRIGDHVWLGSNCMLLKGCKVANDSIIAAKACVTKSFSESNVIIGNNRIIVEDITWER